MNDSRPGIGFLALGEIGKNLADILPVIIYEATLPGFFTSYVGGAITAQLGFDKGEFLGDIWTEHIHEEDKARVARELALALEESAQFTIRYRLWNRGRSEFIWVEDRGMILKDADGVPASVHGAMFDVTENHELTEELKLSGARYRQIFDANPVPLWIYDLETLRFLTANEAAVSTYGYSREEFLAMTLLNIRPEDDHARLIEEAKRKPEGLFDAGIWTHRTKAGRLIQVRILSHGLDFDGHKAELVLATDITEPLANARRAQQAEKKVRASLTATIEVLAAAGDARDPYTAGHQHRVAGLAVKIAERLDFSPDRVEGLRLAATVHDIGKLAVPSDLLTLPRRLTNNEMALIRDHAKSGYELLKGVEFPWPIADVVLHHHERWDGSGYPDGLKGEQILVETRIVAVADVVEAMASHRPYRPGKGIDLALDEIRTGSGRFYDPEVVDACLSVFKDGYCLD